MNLDDAFSCLCVDKAEKCYPHLLNPIISLRTIQSLHKFTERPPATLPSAQELINKPVWPNCKVGSEIKPAPSCHKGRDPGAATRKELLNLPSVVSEEWFVYKFPTKKKKYLEVPRVVSNQGRSPSSLRTGLQQKKTYLEVPTVIFNSRRSPSSFMVCLQQRKKYLEVLRVVFDPGRCPREFQDKFATKGLQKKEFPTKGKFLVVSREI